MSWQEAKDIILSTLALGVGSFLIQEIKEMRKSVQNLNEKFGIYMDRTDNLDKRVEALEPMRGKGVKRK